ncbi:O-antigen ligase family protein [Rubritalea tangerina]|uniref:O-antigen ligase family protein n=1 Tax=Rubritalea tangerina TaxID=430798 RepID=A0ABW4ZB79_9BACT
MWKEDVAIFLIFSGWYLLMRLERRSQFILWGGLGIVLLNAVVFFLQSKGVEVKVPIQWVSERASEGSVYGFFTDYGALGNAMAMLSFFLGAYAMWGKSAGFPRILMGVAALVSAWIASVSGSRSAVFSLLVGGGVLFSLSWLMIGQLGEVVRRRYRFCLSLVGVVSLIIFVVVGMSTFIKRDVRWESGGVATSSNIRESYWGMAMDQWLQSPMLGTGGRSYSYEGLKFWGGGMSQGDASPEFVHNEYIQVLGDYGVVGFIIFCVILCFYWRRGVRECLVSELSPRSWKRVAGVCGLTVMAIHCLGDFPMRLPFNAILAATALAWCLPRKAAVHSRDANVEPVKAGSLQVKVACIGMLAVMSCAYAGREVWAAVPLIKNQQVREDGEWIPEGHEDLLDDYRLANQRSADFRRSQRIGQLFHLSCLSGAEEDRAMAISYYEESLGRNPYNPVPMVNLGSLYSESGDWERSEEYYLMAEPYAGERSKYFGLAMKVARNKVAQAEEAFRKRAYSHAESYLVGAIEVLAASSQSPSKVRLERDCMVSRIKIALVQRRYDDASHIWEDMKREYKPWVISDKDGQVHLSLANSYYDAANGAWREREPELAKGLYEAAVQHFLKDKATRRGSFDRERDEKLEFCLEALKVMEQGGVN